MSEKRQLPTVQQSEAAFSQAAWHRYYFLIRSSGRTVQDRRLRSVRRAAASQMPVVASALPSFTAAWSAAWSRSFWSAYFSAKSAIAWSNLPEPPR